MNEPAINLPERGGRGRLYDLVQKTAPGRTTRRVRLDQIAPDPDQPRTKIDAKALSELADSIRQHGILQPIIVRESRSEPPYYLVSGERRWRAAAEAELEQLDVLLEEVDGTKSGRRLRQLVENIQRDDLSLLDTARALEALIQSGISAQDLAKGLGKSASYVSQHLATLKTDGPTREALEEGHLQSAETLRLFDALPPQAKRQLLATARSTQAPIGRGQVETASPSGRKRRKKPARKTGRPALYSRRFQPEELRALIVALGGTPAGSNRELGDIFNSLVEALTKGDD